MKTKIRITRPQRIFINPGPDNNVLMGSNGRPQTTRPGDVLTSEVVRKDKNGKTWRALGNIGWILQDTLVPGFEIL